MKRRKYSPELIAQAVKLIQKGEALVDIAGELKVPVSRVTYWKKKAANGSAKPNGDARVSDALAYLRHGRKALNEAIRKGTAKQASRAELHMLLALDSLETP